VSRNAGHKRRFLGFHGRFPIDFIRLCRQLSAHPQWRNI
jgi:hypothetical protein